VSSGLIKQNIALKYEKKKLRKQIDGKLYVISAVLMKINKKHHCGNFFLC
jgi:hypothetical protein